MNKVFIRWNWKRRLLLDQVIFGSDWIDYIHENDDYVRYYQQYFRLYPEDLSHGG